MRDQLARISPSLALLRTLKCRRAHGFKKMGATESNKNAEDERHNMVKFSKTLVAALVATATAMPHRDSIVQLACQCPQFHVRQHITRQTTRIQGALAQRICPSDYIQDGARYLLCGSVTFVRDMWRELTDCGVAPEHISTEVFFE